MATTCAGFVPSDEGCPRVFAVVRLQGPARRSCLFTGSLICDVDEEEAALGATCSRGRSLEEAMAARAAKRRRSASSHGFKKSPKKGKCFKPEVAQGWHPHRGRPGGARRHSALPAAHPPPRGAAQLGPLPSSSPPLFPPFPGGGGGGSTRSPTRLLGSRIFGSPPAAALLRSMPIIGYVLQARRTPSIACMAAGANGRSPLRGLSLGLSFGIGAPKALHHVPAPFCAQVSSTHSVPRTHRGGGRVEHASRQNPCALVAPANLDAEIESLAKRTHAAVLSHFPRWTRPQE